MNRIIRCIAVDDEPIALNILKSHAQKVPFIQLDAIFLSATEALSYLRSNEVDLVFLDINMPDLSGIEFASLAGTKAKIIFTTAYPEYAVQGFELAAVDYLLKPINCARFIQACNRVQELFTGNGTTPNNFLFVKDGYNLVRINLDELLYIEADDNYLTFYEAQRKTVVRMTLSEVMEKLNGRFFSRVHKSYIVSLTKIEKIERHQLTIGKALIPVSNTYRTELLQRLALPQ